MSDDDDEDEGEGEDDDGDDDGGDDADDADDGSDGDYDDDEEEDDDDDEEDEELYSTPDTDESVRSDTLRCVFDPVCIQGSFDPANLPAYVVSRVRYMMRRFKYQQKDRCIDVYKQKYQVCVFSNKCHSLLRFALIWVGSLQVTDDAVSK